jgi:uncharacterized delta-60 repeat protein
VAAGGVYFGPLPGGTNCYGERGLGAWAALIRYNPDGSLDPSFGTDGEVLTNFGTYSQAYAVALAPHGKIVIGGYAHAFALARYKANGSLDGGFGGDGMVIAHFGAGWNSAIAGVAVARDGKVIAAGSANPSGDQQSAVALARYKPDGRRDMTFGKKGLVANRIPGWRYAGADGVALQRDGKIDIAGEVQADDIESTSWLVARYLGERPCIVPKVRGDTRRAARRKIHRANCSLGRVAASFSRSVPKGHVIAQRPHGGKRRPAGTKVNLLVSKGKRR